MSTLQEVFYIIIKENDWGALATICKIGLVKDGNKISMSYTNPDYILRAYLGDDYNTYRATFESFKSDLKTSISGLGIDFKPFGGSVKAKEFKKYHYKIMMPYFSDPVKLKEFASFSEGMETVEANLRANKGGTKMVYKFVCKLEEVAVYGIGLESKEDGEAYFLPKIGEAHAAPLPYEIILQGTEATILHGKYRIALHWPELTMGTFMKIMSTPGDIEDTLESFS
jgi:hypothetical protein